MVVGIVSGVLLIEMGLSGFGLCVICLCIVGGRLKCVFVFWIDEVMFDVIVFCSVLIFVISVDNCEEIFFMLICFLVMFDCSVSSSMEFCCSMSEF